MKRRIISLILVFVMMFSTVSLTSCSSKKAKNDRWEISDDEMDNIVSLDIETTKNGNERILEIKSDACSFKESMSADDVRVLGMYVSETKTEEKDVDESDIYSEETSTGNEPYEPDMREVKTFELTDIQADSFTIKFEETDNDVNCYYVYVHKDGTKEQKYASGTAAVQQINKEDKSYEVELMDSISLYENNPVIDIKHEDSVKISVDVSKDNITLSGAFSGMSVESVITDDNHTVVKLSGKANNEGQGIITFSDDVTDCGLFIVKVNVKDTMLSIDDNSISYEPGKIVFDIVNYSSKFTKDSKSEFTVNDKTADIIKYSDDGSKVTVSVSTDAKDIDSAIDELTRKVISANAESAENGMESFGSFLTSGVSMTCALKDYDLRSDYIETTWDIYITDGTVKSLSEKDIVLWNKYKGSDIETIEKISDVQYSMKIKTYGIPDIMEKDYIYGAMSIINDQAVNKWGTAAGNIGADMTIHIVNGGDSDGINFEDIIGKAKSVLSAAKLFGFPSGPFEKILDFCGEYAEQADSVSSFAKFCLSYAGIIDEDDKGTEIGKQLSDINNSISDLKEQINSIENMIQANDNERRQSDDYKHYADYRAAWKAFYNGELKNMQDIMERYKTYYDEYIITFMKNSGKTDTATGSINNGTLNVFLNKDGKVEVPSTENESYSLYYSETALKKYVFVPEHLTDACVKYEKDGFENAVELILSDSSLDGSIDKFNKANGTNINKNDLKSAIETQAASYAISKIGASEIIKTYNDFATEMTSNDIMYGNIMETYIKMLSYCYNFQSEAKDDILSMQNYLELFTIRSSAFASYVSWFSPSYKRKENPIQKQYDNIMKILDKEYLHDVSEICYLRDGHKYRADGFYDWSYILNDKIHATCIKTDPLESNIAYAVASHNENDIVTQKEMQLIYNRYLDMYNRKQTTASTFTEYLMQRNIIVKTSAELADAWVTLKYEEDDKIDEDEQYVASDITGNYFTYGQHYKYGKKFGNDNKASTDYCFNYRAWYRTGYKLEDIMKPAEKVRLCSYFRYYENHWYWRFTTKEIATLEKFYDMRTIIFTRGTVGDFTMAYDGISRHKDDYVMTRLD